jgi:hypothetical protein
VLSLPKVVLLLMLWRLAAVSLGLLYDKLLTGMSIAGSFG